MHVRVAWTEVESKAAEFEVPDDFDITNENWVTSLIETESGNRSVIVDDIEVVT